MHEKEFEAKRQQPLLAVYSQSGVKSFYLDQQGSSISFFWVQATHPSLVRGSQGCSRARMEPVNAVALPGSGFAASESWEKGKVDGIYAVSSSNTFPMSASRNRLCPEISRGAQAISLLMQTYLALAFCCTCCQKLYFMMPGVLCLLRTIFLETSPCPAFYRTPASISNLVFLRMFGAFSASPSLSPTLPMKR